LTLEVTQAENWLFLTGSPFFVFFNFFAISGIKTSKLGGVNTLIIVLNKTTETSREELLLILVSKSLNPHRGHWQELK